MGQPAASAQKRALRVRAGKSGTCLIGLALAASKKGAEGDIDGQAGTQRHMTLPSTAIGPYGSILPTETGHDCLGFLRHQPVT